MVTSDSPPRPARLAGRARAARWLGAATAGLVLVAVFSLYLRPSMSLEFGRLLQLCGVG